MIGQKNLNSANDANKTDTSKRKRRMARESREECFLRSSCSIVLCEVQYRTWNSIFLVSGEDSETRASLAIEFNRGNGIEEGNNPTEVAQGNEKKNDFDSFITNTASHNRAKFKKKSDGTDTI